MATGDEPEGPEFLRVDRWLWCARFYKSRAEAQRAVNGGHVHVNGVRVKPARALKIGDILLIRRGLTRVSVTVLAIPQRRGPAAEALRHYELVVLEDRRPPPGMGGPAPSPGGRPGKRDRRRLRALSGK